MSNDTPVPTFGVHTPMPYKRPTLHRPPVASNKPAGHEVVLKAIQKDGREIRVRTRDGVIHTGILVAYDKYTLSIKDQSREPGDVTIFFKHALVSFAAETPTKSVD